MASVKAPPAVDYCTALTAGWRMATLAIDKVVRPINLARNIGALAAGQWIHNDGVCYALPDTGKISVEKEKHRTIEGALHTDDGTYIYIMGCCFGLELFWRVFLP